MLIKIYDVISARNTQREKVRGRDFSDVEVETSRRRAAASLISDANARRRRVVGGDRTGARTRGACAHCVEESTKSARPRFVY